MKHVFFAVSILMTATAGATRADSIYQCAKDLDVTRVLVKNVSESVISILNKEGLSSCMYPQFSDETAPPKMQTQYSIVDNGKVIDERCYTPPDSRVSQPENAMGQWTVVCNYLGGDPQKIKLTCTPMTANNDTLDFFTRSIQQMVHKHARAIAKAQEALKKENSSESYQTNCLKQNKCTKEGLARNMNRLKLVKKGMPQSCVSFQSELKRDGGHTGQEEPTDNVQ